MQGGERRKRLIHVLKACGYRCFSFSNNTPRSECPAFSLSLTCDMREDRIESRHVLLLIDRGREDAPGD